MTLRFQPEAVETWPLDRLGPYARNARTHSDDQVAKIAASMTEFGWTQPVLVAADGEVVAGHGRILAAGRLGLDTAPVIVLGHLDEAERRACRIADNRLTELGGWDETLLAGELKDLVESDVDLSLIGFTDAELDRLLALDPGGEGEGDGESEAGGTPTVVVPEPPRDPVARAGDLWLMGEHRLLCGDSTDPGQVRRLMNGERAILLGRRR